MIEIADGVWQLPLLPRNMINAYLIGDVLIDTGIKQSAGRIKQMLGGRNVSAIALTHAHGDHGGSVKELAGSLDAEVWCGAADRDATETGRPVLSSKVTRLGLGALGNAMGGFAGTGVGRKLQEGDPLAEGFMVLATPGHSPGHVSFWRESDRTLLCGDVFFNLHLATAAPGLRQPPGLFTPDPARNRASEHRLADLEPATCGFGHGPVMRGDAARQLRAFVDRLPPG